VNLEDLRNEVAQFAKDRDWDQFHSVRNVEANNLQVSAQDYVSKF